MTARVISMINYKGGTGKTTCTVNIAANLARYHDKKVLLVDGDPQTNATAYVMNPETRYEPLRTQRKTLRKIFEECGKLDKSYAISDLVVEAVVERDGKKVLPNLDLLPSDPELIKAERWLAESNNPFALLRRELQKVGNDYDYIMIDCAPNLYALTKNCIIASDYYIVPMIPDYLSALGMELLVSEVYRFGKEMEDLKPQLIALEGVIFTRVKAITQLHTRSISEIIGRLNSGIPDTGIAPGTVKPYNTYIRDLIAAAEAAEHNLPLCLYKPGSDSATDFRDLTEELVARV